MARPLRIVYEGAVYHVTLRGNARAAVFETDRDRERFLFSLEESLQRYDVRLYLFCLMTNHIHLVLETPRANLSAFMQRLQTAYTVWYNRKHDRSGHLFQGRFGAALVEEDEYVLKLSRYVHLNPVFIAEHAEKSLPERREVLRNYPWSSYRSYVGLEKRLDFVRYDAVLGMMGRRGKRQMRTYQGFVESGIQDIDAAFIERKNTSRLCIGTEECLERVQEVYDKLVAGHDEVQDISFRHESHVCDVEDVLRVVCDLLGVVRDELYVRQRNSWLRPLASQALSQYCGLSQREIAKVLHIGGGASVSKQLKLLGEEMRHNEELMRLWQDIEKECLGVVKT